MLWWHKFMLRSNSESRNAAINKLWNSGNPRAVEALVAGLKFWDHKVKVQLDFVDEFGKIGAVSPLLHALNEKNGQVRARAAEMLGNIQDKSSVESLIMALKTDKTCSVRVAAARALGAIGGVNAMKALLVALNDRGSYQWTTGNLIRTTSVKKESAEALKNISSQPIDSEELASIVPSLAALVLDKTPSVRHAAFEVLGNIGDSTAIKILLQASIKEKYAADVLKNIKNQKAVEPFLQVMKDRDEDGAIRAIAAEALGELGDPRALEPLLRVMKDRDEDGAIRAMAAKALGIIRDQKAVEPLLRVMKDRDEDGAIRAIAAEALGELGDPRALEPLLQAMQDGWGFHYTKALGKLGLRTAAEAVIEDLFSRIPDSKLEEDEVAAFRNLFGNYTNLILSAGRYTYSRKTLGVSDPVTNHYYDFDLDAVEKLCNVNTPISSNILYELSKIKSVREVISQETYMGDRFTELSFEPIRSLAHDELIKRGNPSYDPAAYLDSDAWNISISRKRTTPR